MPIEAGSSPTKLPVKSRGNRVTTKSLIIGYHSVDKDRNYLPDSSKLLYFHPPEDEIVALDLDDGRDKSVTRSKSFQSEGISLLLKWIMANRDKVKTSPDTDRSIGPNFVCSGNTLTKFLIAPYAPKECWKMWAAKFKGTIYLRAEKNMVNYFADEDAERKFTFWGHKFEQYIMSESPDKPSDTTKPVIEPEEFRCVYRIPFGKYWVLFSTVMKGVCSKEVLEDPLPLDKLRFIDLKTSKMIEHAGHEKTLRRHKFLKWWTKGFLTNTDEVMCGFRDDNGIVNNITTYRMGQLEALSQEYWKPEECIKCCNTLLTKLAESVVNDCDETIYQFEKISHEDFNITEMEPTEKISVLFQSYMDAMG